MKLNLVLSVSLIFIFSSCMKTKTCTCTYPGTDEVYSVNSKKTNSKRELKDFEDKCKNEKLSITTEDGFGNYDQVIYSDVCKIK
ncbi:MAG: hypothetical protein V4677_00720 [Bacteroidota bacterium]